MLIVFPWFVGKYGVHVGFFTYAGHLPGGHGLLLGLGAGDERQEPGKRFSGTGWPDGVGQHVAFRPISDSTLGGAAFSCQRSAFSHQRPAFLSPSLPSFSPAGHHALLAGGFQGQELSQSRSRLPGGTLSAWNEVGRVPPAVSRPARGTYPGRSLLPGVAQKSPPRIVGAT